MFRGLSKRLSYSNVMATIAVFVALGGGAYAISLDRNDVRSKHIKKNNVRGSDVDEGSLDPGLLRIHRVQAASSDPPVPFFARRGLQLSAQCAPSPSALVTAATTTPDAVMQAVIDDGGMGDAAVEAAKDFDPAEGFPAASYPTGQGHWSFSYSAPDGAKVSGSFTLTAGNGLLDASGNGCLISGHAIASDD